MPASPIAQATPPAGDGNGSAVDVGVPRSLADGHFPSVPKGWGTLS